MQERDEIVRIAGIFDDAAKTGGGLEIRRARTIDENGVEHFEIAGFVALVVRFFIHEHEQGVAKTVHCLPCRFERA